MHTMIENLRFRFYKEIQKRTGQTETKSARFFSYLFEVSYNVSYVTYSLFQSADFR